MLSYYSTNGRAPEVDLAQALLRGQAPDRGLYLPRPLPVIARETLARGRDWSYPQLATRLLAPYCEGVFSRDVLEALCHDAYDFEVPLEPVEGRRYVLRLDRGPTASFKDFAARFMGRALGRLVRERGRELLILTATSGDTGSAVASAFHRVPGVRVLVLFPIAEVSDRQRKQMTTLGDNIATLALPAKFDDCQALVKQAFADPDLQRLQLSSANSINIGRLLPQSVYYVWAATRLADAAGGEPVVFSVPSGNFGDLLGGVLAFLGGLPVARFVIATNANDEVPRYLATGRYDKIVPSRVCISNAMNVGHPSNLARLVALYGGQMDESGAVSRPPDLDRMRRDFFATSVSDDETRATIARVWREQRVLLEPHGAVGWAGLTRYLDAPAAEGRGSQAAGGSIAGPGAAPACISLETAHPAKFPEELRAITGVDPSLPPSLQGLEARQERYGQLEPAYGAFKQYLLKEYGT